MSLLPDVKTLIPPFDGVKKLISANTAFVNPVSAPIINAVSSINRAKDRVLAATDILNPNYNPQVAANSSQIIAAMGTLTTTLGRFGVHTDALSGIGLGTGLGGSNLVSIASIVDSVQKYKNEGAICSAVYGAFGAIMKAAEIINSINALLGMLDRLSDIPEQIEAALLLLRNQLENQIETDLLAFANAKIEALELAAANAITSLIGNPCISDVLTKIAGKELKVIMNEKIRGIFP